MGIIYDDYNKPTIGPYDHMVSRIVKSSDPKTLSKFIMSVGIMSNHGNWITSSKPNKELRVLQQSYDWLLFLTDRGLTCFVEEAIMSGQYPATQSAFYSSHTKESRQNPFTKSNMDYDAHIELVCYFTQNMLRAEGWLDAMSLHKRPLGDLKRQVWELRGNAWAQ